MNQIVHTPSASNIKNPPATVASASKPTITPIAMRAKNT